MNIKHYKIEKLILSGWIPSGLQKQEIAVKNLYKNQNIDIFWLVRQWLNRIEIKEPQFAIRLSKLIPARCPFERKIVFCGRTLVSIPPLCKLNPLYDELIALRFRAICYLVDECGEDIGTYC